MGAGLRCNASYHIPCTGKTSALYSSLFRGARFFHPCLIPYMEFRFNWVRSRGCEGGFDRVLNPAPSACSEQVQMHEEELNQIIHQGERHLEVLEDSCSSEWSWVIRPSSNGGFKSSLLSYLPINLVFTPEKSQVSIQVMIRFGSMVCQETAKTTETAVMGEGGSWEIVCSLDDGCSQEEAPVIYLVIPSTVHIFNPTNNIY